MTTVTASPRGRSPGVARGAGVSTRLTRAGRLRWMSDLPSLPSGGKTPSGTNTTTVTNSRPRKSGSHPVGYEAFSLEVTKLRPIAPSTGPMIVPRPPTATQMRICVENRKPKSGAETKPTIVAYAPCPPAPQASTAPSTKTPILTASTFVPKKRTRRWLSRIALITRPKSLRTSASAPAAITISSPAQM